MLDRADVVAGGVETSITLGAHHPGLSAVAVLLQHLEQRHIMAPGVCRSASDGERSDFWVGMLSSENLERDRSPRTPYTNEATIVVSLAGADEGFASGRHLGAGFCRQSYRVARRTHAAEAGWNASERVILPA